jgi:hypothetical protein
VRHGIITILARQHDGDQPYLLDRYMAGWAWRPTSASSPITRGFACRLRLSFARIGQRTGFDRPESSI